jgi:hypothetical protein
MENQTVLGRVALRLQRTGGTKQNSSENKQGVSATGRKAAQGEINGKEEEKKEERSTRRLVVRSQSREFER